MEKKSLEIPSKAGAEAASLGRRTEATASDRSLDLAAYAQSLGERARRAARALRLVPADQRNAALLRLAEALRREAPSLLAENAKDLEAGRKAGLSAALLDRLALSEKRIQGMAQGVSQVAALPDPLYRSLGDTVRPDGLRVRRETVPLGTLLFIFESRPNVTVDAGALCFKSGNAVILRGGKEALHSNLALAALFRQSLRLENIDEDAVQMVETPDRALVDHLLQDEKNLDLVIPRGGEALIRAVAEKSRIPVIKHYKGVCHVYVDASADLKKARDIALNAKVQRPGVCNAMETLLLDRALPAAAAKGILVALQDAGVELRGDEGAQALLPGIAAATPADWDEEYLDLRLAVRQVDGVDGAIAHIGEHGSLHTDAVVAESAAVQKAFVEGLDSASVMVNASTRFADGFEYGLGAEVGISTDKLHARGPMGLESLTTYRWIVEGSGHVRG